MGHNTQLGCCDLQSTKCNA